MLNRYEYSFYIDGLPPGPLLYCTPQSHCLYASVTLVPLWRLGTKYDIGLSYRPASLCSLATQFQTRFLGSIPRPIARDLSFSVLVHLLWEEGGERSERR
jgi:hypothetical protein